MPLALRLLAAEDVLRQLGHDILHVGLLRQACAHLAVQQEGGLELVGHDAEGVRFHGVGVDRDDDLDGFGLPQSPHTPHRLPHREERVVQLVEDDVVEHDQVQAGLDLFGVGDHHLRMPGVRLDPGLAQAGIAVGQDDGTDACLGQDFEQAGLDVALARLPHVQQDGAALGDDVAAAVPSSQRSLGSSSPTCVTG